MHPSPRAREKEKRCPSSVSEAGKKEGKFLLPLSFVLFRPSVDWLMLTMFICLGCYNTVPQTGGLMTTQMHFLQFQRLEV